MASQQQHPTSTKQWQVTGKSGFHDSLQFNDNAPIQPNPSNLGDHDVLVNFHYVSLNYRDLIIPMGKYPFGVKTPVVPGSDGAGTVLATGPRVTRFRPGERVLTLFNQAHQAGAITVADNGSGLGGMRDGTFRQYGVLEETGLVHCPETLDFQQGATLPCAGVTAWNALFGVEGKKLAPGQCVLTQGTGGVSCFAVQFAKAAGAMVVATTSSSAKAETLKKLGADHILNYKENPAWGEEAKKLSPGGLGVDHVVEVGGPNTMTQSLKAVKPEAMISIVGFLGGVKGEKQPTFLDCLNNLCTVRGVIVGSRMQFEQMNRAIDASQIKPVVDEKVFGLEELKEAYQYMWDQKHFGKLTVKIDGGSQSKL